MFDSVRVRLTLWYSVVLALVLILVSATTYLIVRKTSMQRTDTDLGQLAESFLATFQAELFDAHETDAPAVLSAAHQAMIEHRTNSDDFLVLGPDGQIIASTADEIIAGAKGDPRLQRVLHSSDFGEFEKAAPGQASSVRTLRGEHARVRAYSRQFIGGNRKYTLILLHSLRAQFETLETIRLTFTWMILLGLILAGTGGYFLARKSLAPVIAMGAHARRIGATNLHERLPVHHPNDELGQLALTFNDLLDRLDQSFERQRRFIADASHELRTPLAILRGEAEVAMSQRGREAEEYLESLRILHQETTRLIKIVEDLFTLTRADSGQYKLTLENVYLEELVSDCAHSARSLAREKNIELVSDAPVECLLRGDAGLLRRMILNLLDNAIKYTGNGGRVEVACSRTEEGFEISVKDTGSGIPRELQSRVFERFFRADPARSRGRSESGAGLGLSIASWIAEAHNGRLKLVQSDAHGSHFAVYLPNIGAVAARTG